MIPFIISWHLYSNIHKLFGGDPQPIKRRYPKINFRLERIVKFQIERSGGMHTCNTQMMIDNTITTTPIVINNLWSPSRSKLQPIQITCQDD